MALMIEQITSGSGNWQVPAGVSQITVLVVAGGGGGGSRQGGGGGAGGLIYQDSLSVTPLDLIAYSIGSGGAGGTSGGRGANGGNTVFGSHAAIGGGGGGGRTLNQQGSNGGSGGGSVNGDALAGGLLGGAGSQGNNGGASFKGNKGGGGGGAGAQGDVARTALNQPSTVTEDEYLSDPGSGGDGLFFSVFSDYGQSGWFGGGGGAGGYNCLTIKMWSDAGLGGGGRGNMAGRDASPTTAAGPGENAIPNTGGGGGGSGGGTEQGGNGGSGVILIAYDLVQNEFLNQPSSIGFKVNQQLVTSIPGYGPDTVLFNEPEEIVQITMTFDQLGRPLVFYKLITNELKLYWYDPVLGDNTITVIGSGTEPYAIFDFPTDTNQSFTDAVIFYIGTDTQVKYRKQRDRFAIEYAIPGLFGSKIISAGLTTENRVQVVVR